MNEFIKQQQELARKELGCINGNCDHHGTITGFDFEGEPEPQQCQYCDVRDTLITQTITNTGEELMRLAEGEKRDCSIKMSGDYEDETYNQAIDTLNKHISSVTGVKK